MRVFVRGFLSTSALAATLAAMPVPAMAQVQTFDFDIPAQSLDASLRAFARTSRQQIMFNGDLVRGKNAPPLKGSYSADAAVARLLEGSGLVAKRTSGGSWVVSRSAPQGNAVAGGPNAGEKNPTSSLGEAAAASAAAENGSVEQAIVVTGTHIRGANPASPLVTITRNEMQTAGQHNLGEALRALPQNFAGGQNPGVAIGATGGGTANQNITGSSSINLRGLGPDATLTLLDGERLPYDGFVQATDVSAIPLAAVDRVEVLLDGASAIYGSDAVAGVANVVLRRNYNGAEVSGRYGFSTDGGDEQHQVTGLAGTSWSSGSILGTFDIAGNTPVRAEDRDYLGYLPNQSVTIYPKEEQAGGLVSGHQQLTNWLEFGVDAFFMHRKQSALDQTSVVVSERDDTHVYGVAPVLSANFGSWMFRLHGFLGRDSVDQQQDDFSVGTMAPLFNSSTKYTDNARAIAIDTDGDVLQLPAGSLKASIGVGYRRNTFENRNLLTDKATVIGSRRSYYGYGEVNLPIFSKSNRVAGIDHLSIDGAIRYENYGKKDFGDVFTPKIGLVWGPVSWLDLKATWGRSFKTPTLSDQYQVRSVQLVKATAVGASGVPSTATVLYRFGGNRDLAPEKAKTLSIGATARPDLLPGTTLAVDYFNINYIDRVVIPISPATQALSNPVFAPYVERNPSVTDQSALIGGVDRFTNLSGAAYDPANVIAIVDNAATNAAEQKASGIDASIIYQHEAFAGNLIASAAGSWLTSHRRLTSLAAQVPTSGVIFFPADFHGRLGLSWSSHGLALSSYLNRISGVQDTNVSPSVHRHGMTTVDAIVRYDVPSGALRGFGIELAADNLFDESPPYMKPAQPYFVNYDSTNYSALGRVISITLQKSF